MSHTATILDCDMCRQQRESNMLLAMAGHYMGTISERIVSCYIRLKEDMHSEDAKDDPTAELWFSSYHIDNKSERMQVVGSLVWVQLAEFSQLLQRLKQRTGLRSGPGGLLAETEKKVEAARTVLMAGSGPHSPT
jgi:hypothetical protein